MKGWKYESMRHGLAAKGIKSATKKEIMRAHTPSGRGLNKGLEHLKIQKDDRGYETGYYNPDAEHDNIIVLTQQGVQPGWTVEEYKGDPLHPKDWEPVRTHECGSRSAEKTARVYAKKYKYVIIMD